MDPQSHMMTAPTEDSYVTASLKVAASLPTIELMRYIRMFIKHAHYFSNSCRTGIKRILPYTFYPSKSCQKHKISTGLLQDFEGLNLENSKTYKELVSLLSS